MLLCFSFGVFSSDIFFCLAYKFTKYKTGHHIKVDLPYILCIIILALKKNLT